MLGLLAEPGALAGQAIVAQGVAAGRGAAGGDRRPARRGRDVPELIPYDARAQKALELTFREALRLGHNYIGTEHILLALLELEDGTGVLAGLGIDKAAAESQLAAALVALQARHPHEHT